MSQKKQWIVITSGDRSIDEVSAALKEKGFSIDATLDAIGQIIGTGTQAAKEEALKLKGVAEIQASGDINIGPPDSEISW